MSSIAFGISLYGNHEPESDGNSMEVVTPLLTNDKSVIRGTPEISSYNT